MKPELLQSYVDDLRGQLPKRLGQYASALVCAQLATDISPLLLAAIMDRESIGGIALNPIGPGGTGDNGNGLGLMQIDKRAHPEFSALKLPGGQAAWRIPAWNVLYGAAVLLANLRATQGDEATAVAAYNCGLPRAATAALAVSAEVRLAHLDMLTTAKNYVSDVFRRRAEFERGEIKEGKA